MASLQEGLPGEAIDRLVGELPYKLPNEARKLYAWRNGTRTIAPATQIFPRAAFLPLASAVGMHHQLSSAARAATRTGLESQDVYDNHWFPICIDVSGDLHVVILGQDAAAGQVWYVLIEDASEKQLVAPSLASLFQTVAERWDNGTYYLDKKTGVPMENAVKLAAELRAKDQPTVDVTELVTNLRSKQPGARANALKVLKRYLFPDAVAPLITLVSDSSAEVRSTAASLLGQIGDRKALPVLLAAQNDRDQDVRTMVSWALSQLRRTLPLDN